MSNQDISKRKKELADRLDAILNDVKKLQVEYARITKRLKQARSVALQAVDERKAAKIRQSLKK